METTTSVTLDSHFASFVSTQVEKGNFASPTDVVQEALRQFEQDEAKKDRLLAALEEGERSGTVENFDPKEFLAELHAKYLPK